jgi:hypothetical protein
MVMQTGDSLCCNESTRMHFCAMQDQTLTLFVDGYERLAGILPDSPHADCVRNLTAELQLFAGQVSPTCHSLLQRNCSLFVWDKVLL